MIENTRAKFEEWVVREAELRGYKYLAWVLKREGEGYATTWVDSAWIGWQAAIDEVLKCD
jgi:hypothetical protein